MISHHVDFHLFFIENKSVLNYKPNDHFRIWHFYNNEVIVVTRNWRILFQFSLQLELIKVEVCLTLKWMSVKSRMRTKSFSTQPMCSNIIYMWPCESNVWIAFGVFVDQKRKKRILNRIIRLNGPVFKELKCIIAANPKSMTAMGFCVYKLNWNGKIW